MLTETLLGLSRAIYHHPKYPGEKSRLSPTSYLTLPFRKEDLDHYQIRSSQIGIGSKIDYKISEGWWYSEDIRKFIPFRHTAIDFALPYGFPVVAPCDGFAMSSYYAFPFTPDGQPITNTQGEISHFGMGYFIQIYNPDQNRFVQLGHLSDVAESIPFSLPVKKDGKWIPTNNIQTPEEILSPNNPDVVLVRTGDNIGFVGLSGLTYGEDYQQGFERPMPIDLNQVKTIFIPHIHFDEWMRNYRTGKKDWRRDPYDIYRTRASYPTHSNRLNIGNKPLFLTDESDRPLFADS
jgi:hypothetical protein